jgi:glycosyltransferase involved in cell wall biosynthesis
VKILWLKTGPLHPLDTGGKIRTYNMLRALKRAHDITYVSLCPAGVPEDIRKSAAEYCHRAAWVPWQETRKRSLHFGLELLVNFLSSRLPYVIHKYRSVPMAAAICEMDGKDAGDLIVCDFLTPAVNLIWPGRKLKTPSLLFQHNVESLIWKRLHENADGPRRFYLRGQWRRMCRFEREACARFDGVVGVSDEDCEIMRREFGAANVLGSVPTGVDCEYFGASQWPRQEHSVVFLGSMDWMPNIDAVEFFTSEIWPAVKKQFPHATFTVVGRNPPAKIKELEKRIPGVRVTGTVDDVRPFLAAAAAMIVPLRVGGGTRIKIFEGMATGIPVLSTRIGAEGLPVAHGENILLADTPVDFAARIAELFEQPARAEKIGAAGRALVQAKFSWESVTRIFEAHCRRAVEIGSKRK